MTTAPAPTRIAWMDSLLDTPNDTARGGIDGLTRAVAFVIYRHMDATGYARPGTRTIARQAGVSHGVAERRVRLLETAGWIEVARRRGAVNEYKARFPTEQPRHVVAHSTAPRRGAPAPEPRHHGAHLDACRDDEPRHLSDEPRHVRGHEPVEPTTTTSRARSTHEGPATEPKATKPPKSQRVTRRLLWKTMAERQLELAREQSQGDLPLPGSYREGRYLVTLADDFRNTHEDHALKLRDRLPPDRIELWIYELDPRLSKHGWGPAVDFGQARWDEYRAELAARPPLTDEDRAHMRAVTAAAVRQIDETNRRRREEARSSRLAADQARQPVPA